MKKKICLAGLVLCSLLFLFSGYQIYCHYAEIKEYIEEFQQLADKVEQSKKQAEEQTEEQTGKIPKVPFSDKGSVLPDYAELYQQNSHMAGWIFIEGTTINYPVMHTSDTPDFYLNHNFNREYSSFGVPYIAGECFIEEPSDNIIIYGHHIKGGRMFGELMNYVDKSFYKNHKVINFDTIKEKREYEIVAVFKTTVYDNEGFKYYRFVNAKTMEDFQTYVEECKNLALYDTGVSAEYGDKLITLSTCEYSRNNGRLVVVAKRIC